jgi:two-component system, OmpR family, heavy metal sensor histidine kinase CusS
MSFVNRLRGISFAQQLMIWFVSASMVLVLLTASVSYFALGDAMESRDDQVLLKRAATVRELLRADKVDVDYLGHEVSEDLEGPRQLFMRIAGPPNIGIHETPLMPSALMADRFPDVSKAPPDEYRYGEVHDGAGRSYRVVAVLAQISAASGGGAAIVQMGIETTLDAAILRRYGEIIAIVVAIGLGLAVLAGWWFVRIQIRPLNRLTAALSKIEYSTLDYRVASDGLPSELREAALQFNAMLVRLQKAYDGLRRYADDVAHELRTPLNRIQLSAEVALNDARSPEAYREALESNLDEAEHLRELVKTLLFIARAENGQAVVSREPINVSDRLEKIRNFFESGATETGISLTLRCDPMLVIHADNTLFQRAVSNLVANSLAHTPRGGEVSMMAAANDTGVVIEVADTGEGIAPEHQPHVFDRFFRADAARRTDRDRVGLGLAITKTIVDLHRGRVSLESNPGRGTRFSLYFPAA